MTSGIKNKIVTSIYELNYNQVRGGGPYKGFDLLTKTIRNIIFDEYNYVIYTNKSTHDKYNFSNLFKGENITIKIVELNSDYYINYLNPIRLKKLEEGEIWDRIHSVDNYIEVIYNKIEFLLNESSGFDGNVVWIDSGLFGTSCSNAWRDYMNSICHTKNFVDKVFEKINEFDVIALRGNSIAINYEFKAKINKALNIDCFIVPGGLFGGKSSSIIERLSEYKNLVPKVVESCDDFSSEQELLCALLYENTKFFEFYDWDDLQKGILKLMDLYDESRYDKDFLYDNIPKLQNNIQQISPTRYETKKEDNVIEDYKNYSYPMTDREVLDKILKINNYTLDSIDLLSKNPFINQMTTFATLFNLKSGNEHYRLLSYISYLFSNEILVDIGTNNGCSSIALSQNEFNNVMTYDYTYFEEIELIERKNIIFNLKNILDDLEIFTKTRFIFLDANQDGNLEKKIYQRLIDTNFRGFLVVDDIFLNGEMKSFWYSVEKEKYDLTIKGHNVGTGLIIFE